MSKEHTAPVMPPEEHLELLVARSIDGDKDAWKELWLALDPFLEKIAARFRVTGRLSRSVDARRDIVVRIMGGLRENGSSGLAELGKRLACRDGSYQAWLATVARNSAISYVRAHAEYLGHGEGEGGRWAMHLPVSEAMVDRGLDSARLAEARRILAFAEERLRREQRGALVEWMQTEIAEDPAVGSNDAATRLVRSALRRLRFQFSTGEKKGHEAQKNS